MRDRARLRLMFVGVLYAVSGRAAAQETVETQEPQKAAKPLDAAPTQVFTVRRAHGDGAPTLDDVAPRTVRGFNRWNAGGTAGQVADIARSTKFGRRRTFFVRPARCFSTGIPAAARSGSPEGSGSSTRRRRSRGRPQQGNGPGPTVSRATSESAGETRSATAAGGPSSWTSGVSEEAASPTARPPTRRAHRRRRCATTRTGFACTSPGTRSSRQASPSVSRPSFSLSTNFAPRRRSRARRRRRRRGGRRGPGRSRGGGPRLSPGRRGREPRAWAG